MKKVFGILAIVMFSMGLFSCESNNDVAVYDDVATDGLHTPTDRRE